MTLRIDVPQGVLIIGAGDEFGGLLWTCSIDPDAHGASCTGPEFFGAPLPVGPGEEACQAIGFSCRIRIDIALASDVVAATVSADLQACGGGAVSCAQRPEIAKVRQPGFGIVDFSGGVFDHLGNSYTQAGGHPFSAATRVEFPAKALSVPDGAVKDVKVELPPGFVANPAAVPAACAPDELVRTPGKNPECPIDSQVGVAHVLMAVQPGLSGELYWPATGVYKMQAPPGSPALLAFNAGPDIAVLLSPLLRSDGDYGITVLSPETNSTGGVTGAEISLWGVPADPSHDEDRGTSGASTTGAHCANTTAPECSNPAGYQPRAFITNPINCSAGALKTSLIANSWQEPAVFHTASFDHDTNGNPTAVTDCEKVPFSPSLSLAPTTDWARTPSGLEVEVRAPTAGLLNPDGIADAPVKKLTVTLPDGVTLNPSSAEGLDACTALQLKAETATSIAGAGCPDPSRLGSVEVHTPLLDEPLGGSVFLAQQDDPRTRHSGVENPFDSRYAIYVVAKSAARGIVIKLAGKVEPDPRTGQITTTFDDLPQLPFESFRLRLRDGGRAPLVSPGSCGNYLTEAAFVPWSAEDPDNPDSSEIVQSSPQSKIAKGVGGGACPSGGSPPLEPKLIAGTLGNGAGEYSPFNLRLYRQDDEQELRSFSIELPPGLTGRLAGIRYCPDAAIALAQASDRSGAEELANPSCPEASEIGSTLVGAGVGSVLTYVPGKVYLAGPYDGAALSIVAVSAAKVGPFDLGTVVIREALRIDPSTAEVVIDPTGSDPLPHIIDGVPTHLRDIHVYVDRHEFTLNPTSCDPTAVASTVLGSGLDFGSSSDDQLITIATRFQAANCAALRFKPKLSLALKGKVHRRAHPSLIATLKTKPGEANIARAQVKLPAAAFLDNAHIAGICTRVQFAADACPAGSVYGRPPRPARCSTTRSPARSTCAPQPNPAARPRRRLQGPRRPADRGRALRQNRLGQGRAPQHLRSGPRRPGLHASASNSSAASAAWSK